MGLELLSAPAGVLTANPQASDVEMAVYRLLQIAPLGPEEISRLVTAYEETLKALELRERSDPITNMVARKIIELGQTGIRDPLLISALAIKALGVAPP